MLRNIIRLATIALAGALLAGCVSSVLDVDQKASQPVPAALKAVMNEKRMAPSAPILVRIFKQESELEIWKRDRTGRYAHLKTWPMCRWSGQLGPKKKAGDRQAPEGFYHVGAANLNPDSKYWLSFNLGYPNRLEQALGYTGEALMVHGACSSSGCYAMTDEGVAEIYAVARDALKGGQTVFQVQAFPFRMTAKNMALHRNDPNFAFWSDLKRGYDAFETTRQQPKVSYCEGRYVFDAEFPDGEPADPRAACPPMSIPAEMAIAASGNIETPVDELLTASTGSATFAYADGGMHPSFRKLLEKQGEKAFSRRTSRTAVPVSRPQAALADPYRPAERR